MGTVCPLMVTHLVKIKSEKEVDIIGGVSLIYTVVILIWLMVMVPSQIDW